MPSTNNIKYRLTRFSAKIRPLSPISEYTENGITFYLEIRVLMWCTSTISSQAWRWVLNLSVGFLFRFSICKKWGCRHRTPPKSGISIFSSGGITPRFLKVCTALILMNSFVFGLPSSRYPLDRMLQSRSEPVANPYPEVRSNGRIHNAALYSSALTWPPDLDWPLVWTSCRKSNPNFLVHSPS
jgi:hypothetical protein